MIDRGKVGEADHAGGQPEVEKGIKKGKKKNTYGPIFSFQPPRK